MLLLRKKSVGRNNMKRWAHFRSSGPGFNRWWKCSSDWIWQAQLWLIDLLSALRKCLATLLAFQKTRVWHFFPFPPLFWGGLTDLTIPNLHSPAVLLLYQEGSRMFFVPFHFICVSILQVGGCFYLPGWKGIKKGAFYALWSKSDILVHKQIGMALGSCNWTC